MFQRKKSGIWIAALAFIIVFSFVGCEKLKINKLQSKFHFNKANALFTQMEYREAIAEYEAALKYEPDLVQAYRYLGESYKQLYKPGVESAINKEIEQKAMAGLQKALEIEPNNKEIIFSLGDMYDKQRSFDEAEKLFLKIVEIEPGNMANYYVVAEFYKRYSGDPEGIITKKAETMYLRAIEADPENPEGYAYIADYYEKLPATEENIADAIKNYDLANEFREKRIELVPENPEAWLGKGVNRWSRSYRFENVPKEERLAVAQDALKALEKARDLDPEYPEPYSWMSVLYKGVLAKLEPDKATRYNGESDRNLEKYTDLKKRAAERKKLQEELKKGS